MTERRRPGTNLKTDRVLEFLNPTLTLTNSVPFDLAANGDRSRSEYS
jgi:hypothetical protein